jgi:hypothetical protein
MQSKKQTYPVLVSALGALSARIEKLNRRALKMGVDEIKLVEVGPREMRDNKDGATYTQWTTVELDGRAPKFAGWTFVAALQHTDEGNVLRTLPSFGGELPARFRDVSNLCEHCNLDRNRKDTYVLLHDDGTFKQVGRTCLKDFLGHVDPHALAAHAAWLLDVEDSMGEFGESFGGGAKHFGRDQFLAFVAEVVLRHGWVSRGEARDSMNKTATADDALVGMFPTPTTPVEQRFTPSEKAVDMAAKVVPCVEAALAGKAELSDYEWNLKVALASEFTTYRTAGIVASAVSFYVREQERLAAAGRLAGSRHVGVIGDRVTTNVEVVGVRAVETFYGTCFLVKMIDADCNVLATFASKFPKWADGRDVGIGDKLRVKGTISKHSMYGGTYETQLKRVAFDVPEPKAKKARKKAAPKEELQDVAF